MALQPRPEICPESIVVPNQHSAAICAIISEGYYSIIFLEDNVVVGEEHLPSARAAMDQIQYVMVIVDVGANAASGGKIDSAALAVGSLLLARLREWRQPNRAVAQHQPIVCPRTIQTKTDTGIIIFEELLTSIQQRHVSREPLVGNRPESEIVRAQAG